MTNQEIWIYASFSFVYLWNYPFCRRLRENCIVCPNKFSSALQSCFFKLIFLSWSLITTFIFYEIKSAIIDERITYYIHLYIIYYVFIPLSRICKFQLVKIISKINSSCVNNSDSFINHMMRDNNIVIIILWYNNIVWCVTC